MENLHNSTCSSRAGESCCETSLISNLRLNQVSHSLLTFCQVNKKIEKWKISQKFAKSGNFLRRKRVGGIIFGCCGFFLPQPLMAWSQRENSTNRKKIAVHSFSHFVTFSTKIGIVRNCNCNELLQIGIKVILNEKRSLQVAIFDSFNSQISLTRTS